MIVEEPLAIKKKLQDQEGLENSQIIFECELNKPNIPVQWLFNDLPIENVFEPGTYLISQVDNKYTLTMPNAKLKAQGMFAITVPNSNLKSKAILTLDGKFNLKLNSILKLQVFFKKTLLILY